MSDDLNTIHVPPAVVAMLERRERERIVAWIDNRIDGGRGIKECYSEALTLTVVKNAIERGAHREEQA